MAPQHFNQNHGATQYISAHTDITLTYLDFDAMCKTVSISLAITKNYQQYIKPIH